MPDAQPLTSTNLAGIFNEMKNAFLSDPVRIRLELDSSINFIDDSSLYNNIKLKRWDPVQLTSRFDSGNAINVYFSPRGGIDNLSVYGLGPQWGSVIISNNQWYSLGDSLYYHARVVIHEVGHVFGLLHTFDTRFGQEYIRRDALKNCYTTGDRCCDTPAHPRGLGGDAAWYNSSSCTIDSSRMADLADSLGWKYAEVPDSIRLDGTNYMIVPQSSNFNPSNLPMRHCMSRFTPEQGMIMRCHASNLSAMNLYALEGKNRTASRQNIGDSVQVTLDMQRYTEVPELRVILASGQSIRTMNGHDNKFTAVNTASDSGVTVKHYSWNDDPVFTNISRSYTYNNQQNPETNSACTTAWFTSTSNQSKIEGTIENRPLPVNISFRDPWRTVGDQGGIFKRFPLSRNRDTFYTVSTPFIPVGGAILNMTYNGGTSR